MERYMEYLHRFPFLIGRIKSEDETLPEYIEK